MKFKAKIPLNFMQSREAKLMGDKNIITSDVEFTFQDLTGYFIDINEKQIFIRPNFTIRKIIIPWIQKGNIPEIIENEKC